MQVQNDLQEARMELAEAKEESAGLRSHLASRDQEIETLGHQLRETIQSAQQLAGKGKQGKGHQIFSPGKR